MEAPSEVHSQSESATTTPAPPARLSNGNGMASLHDPATLEEIRVAAENGSPVTQNVLKGTAINAEVRITSAR